MLSRITTTRLAKMISSKLVSKRRPAGVSVWKIITYRRLRHVSLLSIHIALALNQRSLG
ncbi:hypothetical protein D3C75_1121720 [compost metagenome]